MKGHAAFLKNIAAFIMLIALVALLLPLCNITTGTKSTNVSGVEMLKIGVDAGYEYYSKGKIDDNYILGDSLTWGDMRAGVTYVRENGGLRHVVLGGVIASLPIVFCFLSMIFTFIAQGKKTMILPTLFITLTFLENIILIILFFKLQQLLFPHIDMTLLVGSYIFTALSGMAAGILGLLWLTGGFLEPKDKKRNADKKKVRFSARDRRRKKDKRNHKRKKQSMKKSKRDKQGQGMSSHFEKNQERHNSDKVDGNKYDEARVNRAGYVTGLTGMYQGMNVEISKLTNGTFTIGTTQEAVNLIQKGTIRNMDLIARNSCIIEYSEKNRQYKVTSYSVTEILLQTDVKSTDRIRLREGDSQVVGSNTFVYIGDYNNSIKLE